MAVDKLVDSTQLDADLTSVANAIRTKGGTSSDLAFPTGFVSAINAIPTGSPTQIDPLSVSQNGTYTAPSGHAYSPVTVNVSGGGSSAEWNDLTFIDYDGTIVASYSKADGLALTELPANPSHEGLIAQGWNYTLAQIKTELNSNVGKCTVGQMYITDDGKTRIYVHFEEGRSSPYFGIGVNGTVVVDWGDNSATDTLTGTSLTTVKTAQHVYTPGDYVIALTVSSGSFSFFGVGNTSHILKKSTATTSNISKVYTNAVQKIELGSMANIGSNAFNYCHSLSTITIPSNVTSIGNSAFNYCYSLSSITIPSGATNINNSAFNYCQSLASITIPSGVTSIGSNAFSNCVALSSITIPSGVTSIGTYAFSGCQSLASITIPSGVTSIGSNAFYNCVALSSITIPSGVTSIEAYTFSYCYGMGEYHFLSATPPTLANANAFQSIQSDCVFYVPAASLEAYKTATNWSTYASYMVGE